MLNQHYFYYVFKISETAIQSVLGLLAIAILIAAIFILIKFPRGAQFRLLSTNISILIAVILFSFAFSNAVYDFDEQPETLISELLPTGEPDCGTAWTGFRDTGNGIGNPCTWGCQRGKVLRKQMRMRGFPPWPQYRREMQCWTRDSDDIAALKN